MYVDRFGWIPYPLDLEGAFGQLRTLPDFQESISSMEKRSDHEGYVYPPFENVAPWHRSDDASNHTDLFVRPANLHKVPATHKLSLSKVTDDHTVLRNAASGFLVHFLGFLLGYRCQFWDWWVDLRISIRSQADYHIVSPNGISRCLELGISSWREWNPSERTIFINAMFLHNRAVGYRWDWERFHSGYQVFDAFYAVARTRYRLPRAKHRDRFEVSCKHFGLYYHPELVNDMVRLRNDLIHEALWGGQMPGTAPDEKTFYMPIWLHSLNQRLGLAILGFSNDYVRSSWNRLSTTKFSI